MELGYRIDGRASFGERDSGDMFLLPTTSAGKEGQHDETRENYSVHGSAPFKSHIFTVSHSVLTGNHNADGRQHVFG